MGMHAKGDSTQSPSRAMRNDTGMSANSSDSGLSSRGGDSRSRKGRHLFDSTLKTFVKGR